MHKLFLLTSILILTMTAAAGLPEALAAKDIGDEKTAFNEFLQLAQAGEPKAMLEVGMDYHLGNSAIKQDYKKAMDWYLKALAQKNADAFNNIGVLYRDGLGVQTNLEVAYDIFFIIHRAALGSEDTQYRAGSNLEKTLVRLGNEGASNAINITVEYIKAFVENKGQISSNEMQLKFSIEGHPVKSLENPEREAEQMLRQSYQNLLPTNIVTALINNQDLKAIQTLLEQQPLADHERAIQYLRLYGCNNNNWYAEDELSVLLSQSLLRTIEPKELEQIATTCSQNSLECHGLSRWVFGDRMSRELLTSKVWPTNIVVDGLISENTIQRRETLHTLAVVASPSSIQFLKTTLHTATNQASGSLFGTPVHPDSDDVSEVCSDSAYACILLTRLADTEAIKMSKDVSEKTDPKDKLLFKSALDMGAKFYPNVTCAQTARHYEIEDIPFDEITKAFQKLSDDGDIRGTMWLARLYYMGRANLPINPEKGIALARKSIESIKLFASWGDPESQFLLGSAYQDGLCVPESRVDAIVWLQEAAASGNITAMNNLGKEYTDQGTDDSIQTARYWFKLAISQGSTQAKKNLDIVNKDLSHNDAWQVALRKQFNQIPFINANTNLQNVSYETLKLFTLDTGNESNTVAFKFQTPSSPADLFWIFDQRQVKQWFIQQPDGRKVPTIMWPIDSGNETLLGKHFTVQEVSRAELQPNTVYMLCMDMNHTNSLNCSINLLSEENLNYERVFFKIFNEVFQGRTIPKTLLDFQAER